jgi:hypothetical protein
MKINSPERLKELKKTHINLVKMTHDELKKIKDLEHKLYLSNFKFKAKNQSQIKENSNIKSFAYDNDQSSKAF